MSELAYTRQFPVINLGLAAIAGGFWYITAGKVGWLLLVLVLVPWGIRVSARRFPIRLTPFDIPLLIFLLTAVMGIFTAYDRQGAGGKFWILLGAIFIYYALAGVSRRDIWLVAGATGPLSGAIGVYFLASNDWRLWPADVGILHRIGSFWMSLRPSFPLPVLHPNTLAGLIAVLLPFVIAFGLYARQKRRRNHVLLTAVSGAVAVVGLIMTSSISTWLALGVGLGIWGLWEISPRISRRLNMPHRPQFVVLLGLLLIVGAIFIVGYMGRGGVNSRFELMRAAWLLFGDFPFTGSGLGTFPALYSQYIQITPVFFVAYSNLYLDVLLELGVVGLLTLLIVLGGSVLRLLPALLQSGRQKTSSQSVKVEATPDDNTRSDRRRSRRRRKKRWNERDLYWFRWATLASLVVILLQSVTDNAFYGWQGTPLLFFASGMAVVVTRKRQEKRAFLPRIMMKRRLITAVAATLIIGGGLLFYFRQSVRATWAANLGALQMARVELANWPTNQWSRGDNVVALRPATQRFERSLAINPNNHTAHYRLGLVAMLQRDYETAVVHLEQAFELDTSHRGVIKSLGYSYVWIGDFEKGITLLAGIREARDEMSIYSQWWRRQNRADLAANAAQMVTLLEANSNE